ncbi:hypothetical protein GCM10010211_16480 [Streptomyces albospinus]|uniref:Uncharacterized protein n=1 Tax=Streptomyces albospinus TaxID=285515 RepID=A0ABQ2UT98_9ACTN|nr:hypothetical protein GCM10010211_16480 [Streptomyces albospinus]
MILRLHKEYEPYAKGKFEVSETGQRFYYAYRGTLLRGIAGDRLRTQLRCCAGDFFGQEELADTALKRPCEASGPTPLGAPSRNLRRGRWMDRATEAAPSRRTSPTSAP